MTLSDLWTSEGGGRELLRTALPLILATSASTIQQVVDRLFLNWYSPEAIAASMPAGILNFCLMTFFLGTAGYANTFIAQYFGAGIKDRIGPVIWQGIYISLIGAVFIAALVPLAPWFFGLLGHAPGVRKDEIAYFSVLSLGSLPFLLGNVLSCFYSGQGRTWPLFAANIIATAVNAVLDYCLIFGHWGFPEMGITGAGIATVIAGFASLAYYILALSAPRLRREFALWKSTAVVPGLLLRMLKYGIPSGLQFFLDVVGWTGVILLIGRIGTTELAASNIAFNLNMFAFMPMVGFGIAVSIVVGQYLGANRPEIAARSVWICFGLTFGYMLLISLGYWFIPGLFLAPYMLKADPASAAAVASTAAFLLKFIAVYSLFDTMNIVFISALKGAGDTIFVMAVFGVSSLVFLILPVAVAVVRFHADLTTVWVIITAYVILLGFVFLGRFIGGKWKSMRVIEPNLLPQPGVPV
jgi:MATE family multidrug resistance protein